jgi:hypothetical protein
MAKKSTSARKNPKPLKKGRSAPHSYARSTAAKNNGRTSGKKWTVMVYMVAQKDLELERHAIRDLQEMEKVGSNDELNIVVQINRAWPSLPQRYHVEPGLSRLIRGNIPTENTGDPRSLEAFLTSVLKDKRYAADQYFLVLWGHAYGLGFGRDHNEPLTLDELRSALEDFKNTREDLIKSGNLPPADPEIELLGANACALTYAEAAYELKDAAQYLVASQIAVPFAGWPYESILRRIKGDTSAETLGKIVVDSYVTHFTASPFSERVAMTLLNLAHADQLKDYVRELAGSLTDAIDPATAIDADRLTQIRTAFLATTAGDVRPLVDLSDLSGELVDLCADLETLEGGSNAVTRINKAAAKMQKFLEPARASSSAAFVVVHKRHEELDELHGVGIFAPFVAHPDVLERLGLLAGEDDDRRNKPNGKTRRALTGKELYKALKLVTDTAWPELVYDKLRQELPSEIVSNIHNSGAVTRQDLSAVTQMLVSIDSAFNKLDRKLAATKLQILPSDSNGRSQQSAGQARRARRRNHQYALLSQKSQWSAAATRRFALLELLPPKELKTILERTPKGNWATRPNQGDAQGDAVDSFRNLENAVAELERAARRTLTHGRFGLGPPDDVKSGLGLTDEDKPGLGLTDEDKPGLGLTDEDKPGLGLIDEDKPGLGLGPQHVNANGQSVARSVAQLFGQVGGSLRDLELAAANLEGTTATILMEPRLGGAERIQRAFKVLAESSLAARRTMKRVLSHPLYGLGPGLKGLGSEDRLALADAGGLSSRHLRLL